MNEFLLVAAAGLAAAATMPVIGANAVEDRVRQYGPVVAKRWAPFFDQAGISYPPRAIALVGLKQEKLLEVYASGTNGDFRFVRSYQILAASGKLGPKTREGDLQVPEGLYRIESLNPNSKFHHSIRIDYPNADDRARARAEKRTRLGGHIMIHGNAVSIGYIAVGDEAAEDSFVLAALCGLPNIGVILSPVDFRTRSLARIPPGAPVWTSQRYSAIKTVLE